MPARAPWAASRSRNDSSRACSAQSRVHSSATKSPKRARASRRARSKTGADGCTSDAAPEDAAAPPLFLLATGLQILGFAGMMRSRRLSSPFGRTLLHEPVQNEAAGGGDVEGIE